MTGHHIDLVVAEIHSETSQIKSFKLARPDGAPLPEWEAGAHVMVRLPDGDERSYSLVNSCCQPDATLRPTAYRLGVRLEEVSRGGSRYMHALRPGDAVAISAPTNNFALAPTDGPVVLLAGGIGITPLLSMAAQLTARDQPFRMIYAGRSRDHLAFLDEVTSSAAGRLTLHTDDRAGIFDVNGLMASLQ